jgi:hypothetical protein
LPHVNGPKPLTQRQALIPSTVLTRRQSFEYPRSTTYCP